MVWGVAALLTALSDALQARFPVVTVQGELSGFTRAASGHCYFSLKDADGQPAMLRCAMFRRAASMVDFAPRDAQQEVFRHQIRLARQLNRPLVIHTREADEDTIQILAEEGAGQVGGVFHCFTGDRHMARRGLDLGFHLSLAGIVTFPRATELKEVARMVPLDRLLVETDSPFLAPVPHRGTRNEPARVAGIAGAIADLRGITFDEVAEATRANFERLFTP